MHTCLVQGGGEEEPGQWKEEAQSSRAGGGRRWLRKASGSRERESLDLRNTELGLGPGRQGQES